MPPKKGPSPPNSEETSPPRNLRSGRQMRAPIQPASATQAKPGTRSTAQASKTAVAPAKVDSSSRAISSNKRKSRNLPYFVTNNENTVMSDAYTENMTPFTNAGPLPQHKIELLHRSKTRRSARGPPMATSVTGTMERPERASSHAAIGLDTQDLLGENLSSQNTVLQELAKIGDTEDHPHEISSRASSSTDGSEVDDSAGEKGSTAPALAKLTEGDNGDGQVADERPGDGKFVPQSATTSDDSLYRPPSPQIKAFAGNGANGVASSRGNSLAQSVRHTHTRGLEASSSVSDPTHDDGPDHTADSGVFDHTSDILVETQDEYPQRKSSYNYPEHAPDGLTVLAALAYQHAKVHGWIPKDMDDASWRATAVPLLCSMDSQVLNRLVHGRRLEPSISDRQQSKWATNGGTEAPVIYARAFCDGRTGRPITAGELRLVIARLRIYTTLEPTDDEVDLITGVEEQAPRNEPKDRHIRSGRRHFFGEQRLTADLHVRASKILSFCQRCEERMQHMEDSEDFRMLFYIGYTLVFTARMEQHRSASGNTSWFMNLFLATCKAVLISKKENWSFQDTALCFCVDETEVFVGEILMTLLSGAWYAEGTGFGIHPPGKSVSSSLLNERTNEQARELWKRCREFRKRRTPYQVNINEEFRRVTEYPTRRWQQLSASAEDVSAAQVETRDILRRVVVEKHARCDEMLDRLATIDEIADQYQQYYADQDRLVRFRRINDEFRERIAQLRPEPHFSEMERQESELPPCTERGTTIGMESVLPYDTSYLGEDHPIPSTELGTEAPGPSNYNIGAHPGR
ncbi:hypothetical protein HBI84_020990 [Parastagonospora nodorum]|nr:hypothetical protein HBI84_020990 [Parastagonospora nodorum]